MTKQTYRVVQWATGSVGRIAIRHFIDNPVFDLVGVLVTNPEKVGRDAGELAGARRSGVFATDDPEAILALDADCVHYAPRQPDLDMICRLLRSGKNVVSPVCYVYPTNHYKADLERIDAACRDGGTSFHGTGVHPGFAGDLLPLTLTRLMSRIDCIHVHETVDLSNKHAAWPLAMGIGWDPDEALAKPGRSPESVHAFVQSMAMVVEGLGKSIEKVTTKFAVARATRDIAAPFGLVRQGTVGGLHYEWTAWADGHPLVVYHSIWTMGADIDADWASGSNKYRIVIEGDPPIQLTLEANRLHPQGDQGYWGLVWTAMNGVNLIPAVCDARPGLVTHMDLGIATPRGLVRPRSADFGEP